MIRFLLILMLALMGASASAQRPAQPDHITYTVKAGDTLIGLAQRGFRRQADYVVAQRLNSVRNPRVLRIGSTLRLPRRILRVEPIGARVIAFRGAAQVSGAAAQVDMEVREGAVLSTGANAFLAIELADGSVLTLPSRSRMNVAGLHRIVLTGDEVKRFVLANGRTETSARPSHCSRSPSCSTRTACRTRNWSRSPSSRCRAPHSIARNWRPTPASSMSSRKSSRRPPG